MRLLETKGLTLHEFVGDKLPRYAILSHTWNDEELTFQDVARNDGRATNTKGYKKLLGFVREARRRGYQYAWIDTCCIDKSSSSELTEAINSMFTWYQKAVECFAYLEDVEHPDRGVFNYHRAGEMERKDHYRRLWDQCRTSRWFTRGWTLQELLAPKRVRFFTQNWNEIDPPMDVLCETTGIQENVLRYGITDNISVAQKMRWASSRTTTRIEDMAYCLMGLFDVNMPLLYGEGMKAFTRLQEEIIRRSDDETIFLWKDAEGSDSSYRGIFARHPAEFVDSQLFVQKRTLPTQPLPFTLTNAGLQMSVTLLPLASAPLLLEYEELFQPMLHHNGELFLPVFHCGGEPDSIHTIVLKRLDSDGQRFARVMTHLIIEMELEDIENILRKSNSTPQSVPDTAGNVHVVQSIYILQSIRLADISRTQSISGFLPTANRADFDIERSDTCKGFSSWDGEILCPTRNVTPTRGVLRVSAEVMDHKLQVYLVLGMDNSTAPSTGTVWVVEFDDCPDLEQIRLAETSKTRRFVPASSLTIFKDRLTVQAPLTFTNAGLYRQLSKLNLS